MRLWVWLVCLLIPVSAWAEPITLQWDAVTVNADQTAITDLGGYKVYWGTTPGVHPSSLDVGNVTKATIGGLDPNLNYYFVVTAYDTASPPNESVVSVERSGRPRKVTTF